MVMTYPTESRVSYRRHRETAPDRRRSMRCAGNPRHRVVVYTSMKPFVAAALLFGVVGSACSSASDSNQTGSSTTTVESAQAPSAGPGRMIVTVPEATYGCGPADGIEIRFSVTSNQQFQANVALVVGGRTVATGDPFRVPVGTVVETLPVTLDQEAYGIGEGELVVYPSPDDGALARRPVVLRVSGGGCG